MAKTKRKYKVFSQYYFESEDHSRTDTWKFVSETWAVSEAQAINNVRHRTMGDYGTSQYKPIAVGGHWENGLNWKAVAVY